jgi:hypothetical protein
MPGQMRQLRKYWIKYERKKCLVYSNLDFSPFEAYSYTALQDVVSSEGKIPCERILSGYFLLSLVNIGR